VRDELYFLLGKYYYQKGNFKEAVSLFSTVQPSSEFYVQAKLFEGATHVRELQAKPAVESFKRCCAPPPRAAIQVKPSRIWQPVAGAHVLFDGQFDLAVKYFDRVSQESYDWANSLFEASWANFRLAQRAIQRRWQHSHAAGAVL